MSAVGKSFDAADETRPAGNGRVEMVDLDGAKIGRAVFEPGWRWSTDVKPIAKTDSCRVDHLGYVISGRLHVVTDDGTEMDLEPGHAYAIHPAHDAWVVGDEPFVGLEFQASAVETYAKP